MCDSSVPSRMPAVAATHYGRHMRARPEITTLVLQLTSINDHLWWQFPVLAISGVFIKQAASVVLCAPSSPHYLTWLKTPADSGDGGLQRRHLESRGRRAELLRVSIRVTLPPRHQPFWATDPQIRDSVKSILPHACQHCVCFNSLEGHFTSIPKLGFL